MEKYDLTLLKLAVKNLRDAQMKIENDHVKYARLEDCMSRIEILIEEQEEKSAA